jgi:hypothetical protein
MALTVRDVRVYSKDSPELNYLLEGDEQSSDELIGLAMRLAVSDFNTMGFMSGYSIETFPNDSVLMTGTLHHLANAEAEKQLRNQINYSAQGLTAGIDDKYPLYNSLAQHYWQLFNQKGMALKQAINSEAAWGENFSPYAGLNTRNFRSD